MRLALQRLIPLVPVYSFGETDLCGTYAPGEAEAPWFHWLQRQCRLTLGIVVPFISNLIPRKTPVTTVFGPPLQPDPPKRAGQPTEQEVDMLMARYEAALTALFDRHKEAFAPNRAHDCLDVGH